MPVVREADTAWPDRARRADAESIGGGDADVSIPNGQPHIFARAPRIILNWKLRRSLSGREPNGIQTRDCLRQPLARTPASSRRFLLS